MLSILLLSMSYVTAHGWVTGMYQGYSGIFGERNFFSDDRTDYEIIYLNEDTWKPDSVVAYDLTAFGSRINLRLQPNSNLIAPQFSAIVRDGSDVRRIENELITEPTANCYYLHVDETISAAVSLCQKNKMEGLVFLPNETLEIYPLPERLASVRGGSPSESLTPHIVKKINPPRSRFIDDIRHFNLSGKVHREKKETDGSGKLTIEAALFLDEPGYKIFAPFFDHDHEKLCKMLLAYVNSVQAIYHHPSLGMTIDIALVKMEILKKQPEDLPHFDGERNQLLDSFCSYNEKHNLESDDDPRHWDIGLYISGLNFFAYEGGRRNDATMGLATVSGACTKKYNCIIAEFGTTNVLGKPYPSSGFTSVYVLAHEIGHNLGMHHDSTGNTCPRDGFIMSPSRGTNGETIWSPCSAAVARSASSTACLLDSPKSTPTGLDHSSYRSNPGQIWRAKMQCEILIRDHDAELYDPEKLQDICENLQCKSPHRNGFYFAGPALPGTDCGANKWCQAGRCVKKTVKPERIVKGGWSEWISLGECSSECIMKSKGYQRRRRKCNKPKPVNTDEGCDGPSYEVLLCKDDEVCDETNRKTVQRYATEKCQNFSAILPALDTAADGLQASHEPDRLWMACAIFCKRKDGQMYYTPRVELNDMINDPYFPDGTWCHNDGTADYYCIQHHCLPENFRYVKGSIGRDDAAFLQNAKPGNGVPSEEVQKYFGLDPNGKPLLTKLGKDHAEPSSEYDWTDDDYVEIS